VRLSILGLVTLMLMGALGTRLWFLQVIDSSKVEKAVDASHYVTVVLKPERGRIFDDSGRVLADNRRVLNVVVHQEVILNKRADRKRLFERLAAPLGYASWTDLEIRYCGALPPDPKQPKAPPQANEAHCNGIYSPYLPFPAKEDVPEQLALDLKERAEDFPGVDIEETWQRRYLYAPLASQIVGYLGAIPGNGFKDPTTQAYLQAGYLPNEKVGAAGIEQQFEGDLHGIPGSEVVRIDKNGSILQYLDVVPPTPGRDVQLTINLDLQQFAEQALQTGLRQRRSAAVIANSLNPTPVNYSAPAGALVAERSSTGEIVAMASYPTFDNRWFTSSITSDKFKQLFPANGPDGKPLLYSPFNNLAIQGQYNVGSNFKPFTAWAALDTGFMQPGYVYDDTGTYVIPNCLAERFKCEFRNSWNSVLQQPTRYGKVSVADALAVSSDAFFYRLGAEMFLAQTSDPVLQKEYAKFGFGQRSGIQLPNESAGVIPSAAIKKNYADRKVIPKDEGNGFFVGDSVLMAVGQGLDSITPLQLANGYAAFANGGNLMKPLIVKAIYAPGVPDLSSGIADVDHGVKVWEATPVVRQTLDMSKAGKIIEGLERVVYGPGVPGHNATTQNRFTDLHTKIAGKTGTAQGLKSLPENDSSVFTAFQTDKPDGFTVNAYMEKAGYGAQAAAPLVKCMFEALIGQHPLDQVKTSGDLDINQTTAATPQTLNGADCLYAPPPVTSAGQR
jgi:penicillin-binding protein 2